MARNDTLRSRQELLGLRAVVTGSSRGIGRAIVTAFSRAGAKVVVHGHGSFEEARRVAAELSPEETDAVALRADLRSPDACGEFVTRAFEAFEGVDVWVNNAGADILTEGRRERPFLEKLSELLELDVRATVLLTREAGRRMRNAGRDDPGRPPGSIINVGWDKALTGMEGDSGELYATAKGAILAFSKSAALSLAPEVRVNCVAPGWIRTAWGERAPRVWQERVLSETPLGRWGLPEDVASVAAFLASPASSFLTGQVLSINGGSVR